MLFKLKVVKTHCSIKHIEITLSAVQLVTGKRIFFMPIFLAPSLRQFQQYEYLYEGV